MAGGDGGVLDDYLGGDEALAGGEFGELYAGEDGRGEEFGGLCSWIGLGCLYEYDCGRE